MLLSGQTYDDIKSNRRIENHDLLKFENLKIKGMKAIAPISTTMTTVKNFFTQTNSRKSLNFNDGPSISDNFMESILILYIL